MALPCVACERVGISWILEPKATSRRSRRFGNLGIKIPGEGGYLRQDGPLPPCCTREGGRGQAGPAAEGG